MLATFGDSFTLKLTPSSSAPTELDLIWIPTAKFTMGAGYCVHFGSWTDDVQDHPFEAELSHGFWMGRFPVTRSQWNAVIRSHRTAGGEPDVPVTRVDWFGALGFMRRLNRRHFGTYPPGYGFRLPTEAQWEWACSAGTSTRYNTGESETDLAKAGWYQGNSAGSPQPVGGKYPNRWGLYDMHGNVAEWCRDWADDYPRGHRIDWSGPPSGMFKILRGGGFGTPFEDASLSTRGRAFSSPESSCDFFGFRVCLSRRPSSSRRTGM